MIERTFIEQGMKKIQLEQYMKKQLDRAGFTGLHIVKTPLVTRIVLTVARPGLAIGKGGQNIRNITEEIATKFGIENPQIEIQDIKNPALDAKATVDKMVELLERGYSWKSVVFRTIQDITAAGAQGVELTLKGKLSGKGGRKRKHRVVQGYMKKVGDQVKLVDTAKASAYPKAGAIGITLSIIGPDVVFPDKIDIGKLIDEKQAREKEASAAAAKAAETPVAEEAKIEPGEKKGAEAGEKKGEEHKAGEPVEKQAAEAVKEGKKTKAEDSGVKEEKEHAEKKEAGNEPVKKEHSENEAKEKKKHEHREKAGESL
ncbi:MAG: 30S ribosomal protein S3 [archaeon]